MLGQIDYYATIYLAQSLLIGDRNAEFLDRVNLFLLTLEND